MRLTRDVIIACHAAAVPPAALDAFRTLFQNQAALTRAHPGPAPFGRRLRLPAFALTRAHPGPAPFGRPFGRRLRLPAFALTRAHPGPAPFGRPFGRRLRLPAFALTTLLQVR